MNCYNKNTNKMPIKRKNSNKSLGKTDVKAKLDDEGSKRRKKKNERNSSELCTIIQMTGTLFGFDCLELYCEPLIRMVNISGSLPFFVVAYLTNSCCRVSKYCLTSQYEMRYFAIGSILWCVLN